MLKRILVLLLSTIMLCGCTKNNVEEVSFSSWGSITETKLIKQLITDFEKENPNIKINFMHIPQNYFQKIHLLFASSTPPDIIFINNLYLPIYADYLENLDELINQNEYFNQSIQALSIDGKLLAIPRDISNFVIYYNRNIAGDINSDWTFEDFKNILKKTTNKKHWGISYERDIFIASPFTLTLGNQDGIEFYKNIEGIYAPLPADIGSMTLAEMFLKEQIIMYLSGRWMYPKISEQAKFPFGIVPFPGTVNADASGWAIYKYSKHKNSAKKFIKYLSSKQSVDYMVSSGLIIPARIDSSKLVKEKAFIDAIKQSKVNHTPKNYNKIRDMLNKQIWN